MSRRVVSLSCPNNLNLVKYSGRRIAAIWGVDWESTGSFLFPCRLSHTRTADSDTFFHTFHDVTVARHLSILLPYDTPVSYVTFLFLTRCFPSHNKSRLNYYGQLHHVWAMILFFFYLKILFCLLKKNGDLRYNLVY